MIKQLFEGQIVFISNYPIPVGRKEFPGCTPNYIPDNQLGCFDMNGDELLIDLDQAAQNFILDLTEENAHDGQVHVSRFVNTRLNNIVTHDEIEQFFES